MRVFSPEEQLFLRRIAEGRGSLYTLIDPWIDGVGFKVNTETNLVEIRFDTTALQRQGKTLAQRLQEIQVILIQAVNILKLFEERGYIISYKNSNEIENPFVFNDAGLNTPSIPIPYTLPDPRISELIVKYATQEIYVTGELAKFISDGFITREQGNANRQFGVTSKALRRTTIALYISLAGVLLTLLFNIYNTFLKSPVTPNNATNKDNVDYFHHGRCHKHHWW